MSVPDAWLSTTGAHHQNRQDNQVLPRSPYQRTYWERLSEPSILLSIVVLLLSVLFSTYTISVPSALGNRLWNLLVTVVPASLVFAIDDWLRPFPLPQQPRSRLSPAAARQAKSNALSRIFGRETRGGGGVLSSVSYAGKTGLSRLMAKGSIERPAGLGNMSYSCYQNSILQSLASLAPLQDYLTWIADEEAAGGLPPLRTAHTLGKLIGDLYSPGLNGETLWTPPDLKRMSTFQQQDAQEYFCKLLNEVQEEVEKALKAMQTYPGFETKLDDVHSALRSDTLRQILPIMESAGFGSSGNRGDNDGNVKETTQAAPSPCSDDSGYESNSSLASSARRATSVATSFRIPLEGLVAQRIVCQSCGYSSGLSMNPFYCLTLNLAVGVHEQRLEDALDSFSEVENIEGVQCASCTLRKFRSRIQTIISHLEAKSDASPEEIRLKHPMPYERLEVIETAIFEEDFEEKTIAETCKIPAKQRVESTKSRQVGIARAPPSIAFHINRSRFDETTGYTFKNPAAVRFPLQLDLGPWCLGSASLLHTAASNRGDSASGAGTPTTTTHGKEHDRREASPVQDGEHDEQNEEEKVAALPGDNHYDQEEQWQLPAQQPMVSGTKNISMITGPMYELRAVITHQGQHENGHYICYRKHPVPPQQPPTDEEKKYLPEKEQAVDYLSSEKINGGENDGQQVAQEAVTQMDPTHQAENPTDAVQPTVSEGDEAPDRTAEDEHDKDNYNRSEKEEEAGPRWWRLSDQDVSPSDEQTVLMQGGVFMLFYDRVDATSVFRSPGLTQLSTAGSESGEASSVSEGNDVLSSENTSMDDSENFADWNQAKAENGARTDESATAAAQGSSDRAPADRPATVRTASEPGAVAPADGQLGEAEGSTAFPIS